jgi:pyrroloquinoline quinone biosynthesis protein B
LAWARDLRVKARTQSSLGARNAGGEWVLLNASPDLRQQILSTPLLWPQDEPRDSPIRAVVATNADVDHIAGLLTLREGWPFRLYGTVDVLNAIGMNPVFRVLADNVVERIEVELETAFEPIPDVFLTLFSVPGKVPLWGEAGATETAIDDGRTVGVAIGNSSATLAYYIPGCATVPPPLAQRLQEADVLLFDGTLYEDAEMISAGLGIKTGRRMGHMPICGEGGSLAALDKLGIKRKIFVHINNTNPILIEGSPEYQMVRQAGWEVAEDGMEIAL